MKYVKVLLHTLSEENHEAKQIIATAWDIIGDLPVTWNCGESA
jgi:hypothetical protein